MLGTENKVLDTIKNNGMLQQGDKVVVAVSGGPDSICLLHVLHLLRNRLGIRIVAAHINHNLRGKDSDGDEEFVHRFCEDLNIECHSKRFDIHKLMQEKGISCEMAGREVRYNYFQEIKELCHAQKIAIAHNLNDQAETVLMRIMRGTGIEGLSGIKPVRDSIFIRPLIDVSRREVEKYCVENNLNPRIDKTNKEAIYTRNKIRLELIPMMEDTFNSDIVASLNRLAKTVRDDNDYLMKITKDTFKKYCHKNEYMVIMDKKAFEFDRAILSRLIRLSIEGVAGSLSDIEMIHIDEIIKLQRGETGKKIELPGMIAAYNNYGNIEISNNKNGNIEYNYEYKLDVNSKIQINDIKMSVSLNVIDKVDLYHIKKQEMVKFFDYDKINGDIVLRNKRKGDKIKPIGMNGYKKLKDLFIDLKINKNEREKIPILCFGEEIAWVVGIRTSDSFKITSETKNIIKIEFESGEY